MRVSVLFQILSPYNYKYDCYFEVWVYEANNMEIHPSKQKLMY